jgi:hypothetical protein
MVYNGMNHIHKMKIAKSTIKNKKKIENLGPFNVYIAIYGAKNRIIGRLSFG